MKDINRQQIRDAVEWVARYGALEWVIELGGALNDLSEAEDGYIDPRMIDPTLCGDNAMRDAKAILATRAEHYLALVCNELPFPIAHNKPQRETETVPTGGLL